MELLEFQKLMMPLKIISASKEKENRIYSDDEIKLLPYASKINPHKNEWALRSKSF